jgi:hypothetical protein
MREGGMIRFVKMAVFSGVQQAFFIRRATDSVVKVRTIRFVGLPFIFVAIRVSSAQSRGGTGGYESRNSL